MNGRGWRRSTFLSLRGTSAAQDGLYGKYGFKKLESVRMRVKNAD